MVNTALTIAGQKRAGASLTAYGPASAPVIWAATIRATSGASSQPLRRAPAASPLALLLPLTQQIHGHPASPVAPACCLAT